MRKKWQHALMSLHKNHMEEGVSEKKDEKNEIFYEGKEAK